MVRQVIEEASRHVFNGYRKHTTPDRRTIPLNSRAHKRRLSNFSAAPEDPPSPCAGYGSPASADWELEWSELSITSCGECRGKIHNFFFCSLPKFVDRSPWTRHTKSTTILAGYVLSSLSLSPPVPRLSPGLRLPNALCPSSPFFCSDYQC